MSEYSNTNTNHAPNIDAKWNTITDRSQTAQGGNESI